jgi:hypothetical protein
MKSKTKTGKTLDERRSGVESFTYLVNRLNAAATSADRTFARSEDPNFYSDGKSKPVRYVFSTFVSKYETSPSSRPSTILSTFLQNLYPELKITTTRNHGAVVIEYEPRNAAERRKLTKFIEGFPEAPQYR